MSLKAEQRRFRKPMPQIDRARPPFRHASKFGAITLRYRASRGTLTYEQKGGNQSTVDRDGVSLDAYIHALHSLLLQKDARKVLMIGCGGGTLATMLARAGVCMTVVDIDPVSIKLARRYFGLPKSVRCHVGDGLAFLQKARSRYDALVVDAFIGEAMPAQMKGLSFFAAARRCLAANGIALVNVCLDNRRDLAADRIAAGFADHGWPVRLLDMAGTQRNAIVAAGAVKDLRRPRMTMPPATGAGPATQRLKAMRFRRRRAVTSV